MEHIKNIEIKNFKSIRHAEIKDCRRVNVFIGYPNVGKSNILEALSMSCITNETVFTDFVRVKEVPTLFFNGSINNNIEIEIDNRIQISCKYINAELQVVERYLESNDQMPTLRENYFIDFKFKRSIAPQAIVPEPTFKKYEFKKDKVKRRTQYFTLDIPFGENIFSIIQTNEVLNEEAASLLKDYGLELLYDSGTQAFTIFKRINKGIFTIPYELLADTLQRLIFYKAAILSNSECVLLFEEPEAHMFPPYMRKFTADVIFDKTNQFFIATHSPYVLGEFIEEIKDDLSVYVVDYDKGETVIKRLTDDEVTEVSQYGIDLFFNLESYLDKYGQPRSA